ncbi:MAG: ATP-binding cassette domain-containing protein [Lachnospiraceae bacterium]|nr:ATP-binding cassette domain-containing protein [Lachnospiraceae bacterium]
MFEIIGVSKHYDGLCAVNEVSFQIHDKERVSIQGESGCGKSTLLRMIAGLLVQDEGEIRRNGEILPEDPHLRGVSMVFQDSLLWNHMTVQENILFGSGKKSRAERTGQAEELAETFGIKELLKRYPNQISGGQARRAAIARALACERALLLLDEPFSNLDPDWKERTMEGVRLKCAGNCAILLVTHNRNEAEKLCNTHYRMEAGRLIL